MDQISTTLDERERRIEEAARNNYLVRGRELAAIHDNKLYLERYQTFGEYCEERWELAKRHVYHLIDAAAFAEKVHNCALQLPSRESHIRPLIERLDTDDDRIAVWRDVVATTNGAKIKATDVEDAISRFLALRDERLRKLVTITSDQGQKTETTIYRLPQPKAASLDLYMEREQQQQRPVTYEVYLSPPSSSADVTGEGEGIPDDPARQAEQSAAMHTDAQARMSTMTLDQLTNALRGMPRDAPMLVATADGLCPIVQVRAGPLKRDDGHDGDNAAAYAITLELGEPINRQAR